MATTGLETGPSLIPEPAEMRRALSALRYDQPIEDSPLAEREAVWDLLRREGVAPGERGRAWALGQLLHELVMEGLEAARGSQGTALASGTADPAAPGLEADFAAGSGELEVWSALYHRYLDPERLQAGEIAARAGISRRTLGRRLATGHRRLAQALAARDRDAARRLAERPAGPIDERIEVRPLRRDPQRGPEHGPERGAESHRNAGSDASASAAVAPAPGEALLVALRGGGERRVSLSPAALERLALERPADLKAYRISRVAAWSRPGHRLGARFVDLTLLLDRGEEARERWRAAEETHDDLGGLLEAVDVQAVVLLGAPGSGKSTLLRRYELDLAVAGLREETEALPFLVSLGRYWGARAAEPRPDPATWLAGVWGRRYPELPPFRALLAEGRLVLLLDGLNEMPHAGLDDYRARILGWKRFLQERVAAHPGLRVVFACRSLDYGAPLSSPELRVPQVRVEPLSDAQIRAFLRRYAPAEAERIWSELEATPPLELLRSPYLLRLLVEQSLADGQAPLGRAALFTSFVRRALRREIERDNPLFQPGALLDERDYRRAISGQRWAQPWTLPDRGPLLPLLSRLAHGMQARFAEGHTSQVRVGYDAAIGLLDHPAAEDALLAGEALAVLDEHRGRDEVLFYHQLLQEYFAARRLASAPGEAADRVRADLAAGTAVPALADVLDGLEATEPLPPLPSTGWEEVVLLAASMSEEPDAFLEAVAAANAPLAGRAAAQPELAPRLDPARVEDLRARLLAMTSDERVDLRARIDAGQSLGALGDPRYAAEEGPEGAYLRAPLVPVPAGDYAIGAERGDLPRVPGAAPRHRVRLAGFEIGRHPVTNAEWACFVDAGGYDDDRWWDTADARAWRRGELTAEGSRRWVRDWVARFREEPGLLESYTELGMSQEQQAMWRRRLSMTEAELTAYLAWKYPQQSHAAPYSADRPLLSGPTQPVSGICWYEARAYCRWLSAQTGERYRLPSEAEWEAAARGGDERPFPWGVGFRLDAANAFESHLRRTLPVGLLPAGRAPCGAEVMAGDVGEWTASLWGPDADTCAFPYPYRADDGREDPAAPATVCRVQRGGSYLDAAEDCLAYRRNGLPPDTRFHGFGMRLLREVETKPRTGGLPAE